MLYIIATPIGNLEDITYRAVKILKDVKYIYAEDTRVSKKLLSHYEIDTKLNSYHEHNKMKQIPSIINILKQGNDVALITDAGTPCISDPGYELVKEARKNEIEITSIPGASSILTAASLSGLDMRRIAYEGFLPKKKNRQTTFIKLKDEERAIIILESPNRLLKTLNDIYSYLGNRYVVIAREMTKIYEEIIFGNVEDVIRKLDSRNIKGEIVIVIKSILEEEKEKRKERNNE